MVRGLFPPAEQDTILAVLERSIVFVTTEKSARLIVADCWPNTSTGRCPGMIASTRRSTAPWSLRQSVHATAGGESCIAVLRDHL